MNAKTLYILRHAKSSWDEPDKNDIDRALISRGINDAIFMAKKLKNQLNDVDLIISSPANRAIHTAIIFSRITGISPEKIKIDANIYESTESGILKIVKHLPDDLMKIVIVGHNPTLTYFVNNFINESIDNIPTSGMVGMSFSIDSWKDISKNKLKSFFFEYPKKE